jgi:hypothetical protein
MIFDTEKIPYNGRKQEVEAAFSYMRCRDYLNLYSCSFWTWLFRGEKS